MRIAYSILLLLVGFGAGAAVAGHTSRRPSPPAIRTPAVTAPGPRESQRDPAADLEGQMMWDPNTRTYGGG